MKRKVIPVLIGLLLIVLILAGAAGVFLFQRYSGSKEEADLNAYFGLNGSQEVAIVWNQELTEEKGLLQDERCYLKLDTVHEMLNERFYVDHNEKLLLYTLPEETVQIGIGEQTADGYTAAVEQDGDVWLALDYVKQYSDFNYALYTEPNRVVLTTNWDTLQSAELKKNTALRVRGGVIAVNTATFIGYRYKGLAGGILATLGVISPSILIISVIAACLSNFADIPAVQHALRGVNACVVALIASSVIKLGKSTIIDALTVGIFLVVLALAFFVGISPAILIVCAGVLGYAWRRIRGFEHNGKGGEGKLSSCACFLSLPRPACSPWAGALPPSPSFRTWAPAPAGSPPPT